MKSRKSARGYTTGTCAQAATRAAANMLFTGEEISSVTVQLPNQERVELEILDRTISLQNGQAERVRCGVKKYSGDDPDVTNGTMIYSVVSRVTGTETILEGGIGIGRVTKPGLEQPIGSAAINRVPRKMILQEAKEACEHYEYLGGLLIRIEIPEGEKLAKQTFNPRLGIKGGLSILGTSGIVEPMSEPALVDTIEVEMKVKLSDIGPVLLAAPGNYGLGFLKETWNISADEVMKCSNYVGETIDFAREQEAEGLLFIAHIGKFVKVAGGIMNTHSKCADCRMELLACAALRAELSGECASNLLTCNTTEDALQQLSDTERPLVMEQLMQQIQQSLAERAKHEFQTGAIVFSNCYGVLGRTDNAEVLLHAFLDRRKEKERRGI